MSLSVPETPGSPTWDSTRPPCITWRDRLETELVPGDSSIPDQRKFIPSEILDSLFNIAVIREILDCRCSTCQTCRAVSGTSEVFDAPGVILDPQESNLKGPGRSVVLFAVLVYLGYPSLVDCFLERGINDQNLVTSIGDFDTAGIRNIVRSDVHNIFPRFAERFHWTKFQFFVPPAQDLVRAAEYAILPQEAILPFVNEEVVRTTLENGETVSEGGFGRVLRFEIFEGYGEFPEFPGVRQFARKELLTNTPEWRFNAERRNLLSVKKIGDDHLVKLVTAYKHGNVFNLIFPLAKANLHRYLRDPVYEPFGCSTSVVQHPIWPQLLGIAHALYKVQHFHEDGSSNETSRYGYHLDLKPANILVDDFGRLIITDFGQAVFKRATDFTDSRVKGVGGTETYAPPEFDDDKNGVNRRYDTWSLGCIFLEAVVFVIKGRTGLLKFDASRRARDLLNGTTEDRFCAYDGLTRTYALKPGIIEQIKLLPQCLHDSIDLNFLQKLLDLILHMLDVNAKTRLTSAHVWKYLFKIIHESDQTDDLYLDGNSKHTSERGIESRETRSDPLTMSLRVNGCQQSGHARLHSDGTQLRVQLTTNITTSDIQIGRSASLRLIPDYALHKPGSFYFLDSSLSLVPDDSTNSNAKEFTFECQQPTEAISDLQRELLGHEVIHSWKLRSADLFMRPRKFRRRSSASSTGSGVDGLGQPSSIQLWREVPHAGATVPSTRHAFRPIPLQRRIVVYYSKCVLILRVAKNFRLNKASQHIENHASTLELVPTSESTDRSFSATLLRKRPDLSAPSFALDRNTFELEEANGKVECCSLIIAFHAPHDATLFYNIYRDLKRQWREDVKQVEGLLGRVGSKMWDMRLK